MTRILLLSCLFFFLGLTLTGLYSLFTKQLYIQTRTLKLPLGRTSTFSLAKAPSESLRGTIATFSGLVYFESRTATDESKLQNTRKILQGEILETKDTGLALVTFPKAGKMTLSPDTKLNFIQTLPGQFLIAQTGGQASYTTNSPSPLYIRDMGLLLKIIGGTLTESANPDTGRIIISASDTGSGEVTYNDSQNVSQIVTIPAGNTLIYDDATRTTSLE